MASFSKILSKTDIKKRLTVPIKFLKSLPSFDGGHAVKFEARDEGGEIWAFQCSVRRRGHPKPVLTRGWKQGRSQGGAGRGPGPCKNFFFQPLP